MTKVLKITDSGFIWEVPGEAIAKNRATYYAARDKDTTYDDEFGFTMENDYELRDWFLNNMDWSDVASEAKLVRTPEAMAEPRLNHSGCTVKVAKRPPRRAPVSDYKPTPPRGWNKGKSARKQWLIDRAGFDGEECLTWPFSLTRGYGSFQCDNIKQYAHRFRSP
jgi:hypothetical protein